MFKRRAFNRCVYGVGILLLMGTTHSGAGEGVVAAPATGSFFAFCMETHDAKKRNLHEQATLVKELGFAGVGHIGLDDVPERLRTLDAVGLRLFLVGLRVDLTADKQAYDARVKEVLPLLKGRAVTLYVTIGGMPAPGVSGDDMVVPILREIADLARESGVRVALYPHTGDWLVRVDHAVRLAEKVERPNLGVMFNLCHWLKNEDEANLAALLESALPHLMVVSINGADPAGKSDANWGRLIQPLGQGSFDTYGLVQDLRRRGYRGPIGLMCYGIGGDARDHLSRSMATWRAWQNRLRSE